MGGHSTRTRRSYLHRHEIDGWESRGMSFYFHKLVAIQRVVGAKLQIENARGTRPDDQYAPRVVGGEQPRGFLVARVFD